MPTHTPKERKKNKRKGAKSALVKLSARKRK